MTKHDKDLQEEKDLIDEMQEELDEVERKDIDEEDEQKEEIPVGQDNELTKLKDLLARQQADYDNFKKRVERDKQDMVFFLKSDIFKKILPRVDDLERIVKNTPKELCEGVLYDGVVSLENTLKKDLEKLGVKAFDSSGEEVDPERHDVMTTVAGKQEGIIVDEFEKGYMLGDRVLRHAKVVAGAGE